MATSNTRGGGFLVGVIYGLIASTALFFVLSFLFPLSDEAAPMGGVEMASVEASVPVAAESSAPVVQGSVGSAASVAAGDQPFAPATAAPEMVQPATGSNDVIAVGGAGDAAPTSVETAAIVGAQAATEPNVATEPAGVPDIGSGTRETAVPGGDTAAPPTTPVGAGASAPAAAPAELAASVSGPAIEVFATAFTGDYSKPMMAIVLEDTLETSLQPLVDSGVPITFAVMAGVESRVTAQSIRGAGFEVVALIPAGVSRSEGVAESVARFMQNVPVAVALMDSDSSALMLDRSSMQTVIDTTMPSGLGLISFSRNGQLIARAQAEQAGVPYGSALKIDFDDEELIIQALNQAAFVAGTEKRAIVFAKTRPATIRGLLRWFDSARASQVELVPVSVVLQRTAN